MMSNEALLDEVRRRLEAAGLPARVVVFGSRARGDARADSDLDLMVVIDGVPPGERAWAVRQHLLGLGVGVDLVFYTRDEHERLRRWKSSIAGVAEREGRVLVG